MTRTPEEIFEDILHVMTDGVERLPDMHDDERQQFLTGKALRRHALWDELAKVVARDRDVPGWASLAVVLLRDQFARELQDA